MEETVEAIVDASALVSGRTRKQEIIALAVISQVCWWGGGTLAWYLTKRHYKKKYDEVVEVEIAEAKEFYQRLYKKDEFETPEGAVSALSPDAVAATDALTNYQGRSTVAKSENAPAVMVEETHVEIERTNVFTQSETDNRWDQQAEEARRIPLQQLGEPYIIHHDEYMENEHSYEQVTLAYYAEDDVLADDRDQPIEEIEKTVGEGNLTRFGHGSKDNRMLYVRNDKLNMDFEIVKNDGSFAKEVLGLRHSDNRVTVRKFRGGDE